MGTQGMGQPSPGRLRRGQPTALPGATSYRCISTFQEVLGEAGPSSSPHRKGEAAHPGGGGDKRPPVLWGHQNRAQAQGDGQVGSTTAPSLSTTALPTAAASPAPAGPQRLSPGSPRRGTLT